MKQKNSHKMLLLGVIAFVILAGGASAFSFFSKSGSEESQKNANAPAETLILPLEPFIVNLGDPEGARFLKVDIQLELAKTPAAERAKTRTPQIKDAIIMLLANKTAGAMLLPEGKLMFKDEINMEVNQVLGENVVRNVYFTDFVMQ